MTIWFCRGDVTTAFLATPPTSTCAADRPLLGWAGTGHTGWPATCNPFRMHILSVLDNVLHFLSSRHTSYRHLHSYMDPDQIHRLRSVYPDAREDLLSKKLLEGSGGSESEAMPPRPQHQSVANFLHTSGTLIETFYESSSTAHL